MVLHKLNEDTHRLFSHTVYYEMELSTRSFCLHITRAMFAHSIVCTALSDNIFFVLRFLKFSHSILSICKDYPPFTLNRYSRYVGGCLSFRNGNDAPFNSNRFFVWFLTVIVEMINRTDRMKISVGI